MVAPCGRSSSAALRSASLASALGRAAYVLIVYRVHSREKTKILSYILIFYIKMQGIMISAKHIIVPVLVYVNLINNALG